MILPYIPAINLLKNILYAVLADSDITQLYLYKRYTMRTYQSNEEVTFTSATSFSTCS